MREDVTFIIGIAGIIATVIFGVYKLAESECEVKSQSFTERNFTFVGGCMVKHKGMWLPLENIRGFD